MKKLILQLIIIILAACPAMGQTSEELVALSTDSLMNLGRSSDTDTKVAYLCFSTVASRYSTGMSAAEAENCALALNNCGYILFHAYEDYAKAYYYLAKAADAVRLHKLKKIEPIVCLNLGNLYLTYANRSHEHTDNELALKQYQQGYWAAKQTRQPELQVLNFTNLCAIEADDMRPHKLPREFADFERSRIPDTVPGARFARHMAQALVLAQQGNYDQARQLFRKNLTVIDATFSHERYEYSSYACIGKTFMAQQQWDSAVFYNKKIEQLANRHHMPEVKPETYNDLSRCYKALGNQALAGEYRNKYLVAKDSLLSVNHLDEVGKLHFVNELYKADEELKQMAQQRQRQNMAIAAGSVLLLIIVISLIFVLHKNRIIRNRNLELYKKNVELLNAEKIQVAQKYQNSGLTNDPRMSSTTRSLNSLSRRPSSASPTSPSTSWLKSLALSRSMYRRSSTSAWDARSRYC